MIQILENLKGNTIYISLDEEHTKKVEEALKAYSIHKNIIFIEDDFYEGFVYEDISVYTQQELFHRLVKLRDIRKHLNKDKFYKIFLNLNQTTMLCMNNMVLANMLESQQGK